jgi:hypothetical protein
MWDMGYFKILLITVVFLFLYLIAFGGGVAPQLYLIAIIFG